MTRRNFLPYFNMANICLLNDPIGVYFAKQRCNDLVPNIQMISRHLSMDHYPTTGEDAMGDARSVIS